MSLMHTLRNTPWLARWALLWFALTLGLAVASPLVDPQQELVLCTSAGMVKVRLHADGSLSTGLSSEVQCPLCLLGAAVPPAFAHGIAEPLQTMGDVLPGIPSAYHAVSTAAPPPSRGPPV